MDTQNRPANSKNGSWWLLGLCVSASLGYWLLFRQRDQYVDFQGLFPPLLWIGLITLHLIAGVYYVIKTLNPGRRFVTSSYFSLTLCIHLWVMLDYLGADEQLLNAYQRWQHPLDSQLHDLLEQPAPSINAVNSLLQQGARADSRRDEWAIWKAMGTTPQHQAMLTLLLDHGAQPDRPSRSGIHYRNQQLRVDGPLERLLLQRDKRDTLLCNVMRQHNNYQQSDQQHIRSQLNLVRTLLDHGADVSQFCRLRAAGSVLNLRANGISISGLAVMRRHAPLMQAVQDAGGQLQNATDRELFDQVFSSSTYQGNLAVTGQLSDWLDNLTPAAQQQLLTDSLTGAVSNNQADSALMLLGSGAQPGARDILLQAIKHSAGHAGLLTALVAAGADVNFTRGRDASPLGYAIQKKNLLLLQTLLALQADVTRTNLQHGPLHNIFRWSEPDRTAAAELLIRAGADLERRDVNQHTFLMRAVYANNHPLVQLALKFSADRTATNKQGHTITGLALQHADDNMLKLLAVTEERPGPDLNKLTWAASYAPLHRLQALIEDGYPVDGLDRRGGTALEAASRRDRREIYLYLLNQGADPNLQIRDGSKLTASNRTSSAASVRRLRDLQKDQDPAFSLLAAAALTGNTTLVNDLLEHGAHIEAVAASREEQVLHLVAQAGQQKGAVSHVLLAAGADPLATNSQGYTPMTLAARHRAIEMIEVLHQHGVDINGKDAQGRTALSETLQAGSVLEHLEILIDLGALPSTADLAYARKTAGPSTWTILDRP